jgi:DNA-binding MarR family transcriptional regulator
MDANETVSKHIGFLLAKSYQRLCSIFKEEFSGYDITPQQFGLLRFLWEEDGLTQVELSCRSQIDRTTIGGLIDRMENAGLLLRIPRSGDRRAYSISLTEKGERLRQELLPLSKKGEERFLSSLSGTEIDILKNLLDKLRF